MYFIALTRGTMKTAKKIMRDKEIRYHTRFPRSPLENGRVLVHNSGTRGFRFWSQKLTSDLEPCACGWEGVAHYRVRLLTKGSG
jgi:hypothetical protein